MILIDTSCWIEFYRREGDARIREQTAQAVQAKQAATCGIVYVELLVVIADPAEQRLVKAQFGCIDWLSLDRPEWERAVGLGQALRAKGVTILATDLAIAAAALEHDATIYHVDRHFELIAAHCDLKQKNLRA